MSTLPKTFDQLIAEARSSVEGLRIGVIAGFDAQRGVLVDFPGNLHGLLSAKTSVPLSWQTIGEAISSQQPAVLKFEDEDPERPTLVGLLQQFPPPPLPDAPTLEAKLDGERVVIEGKDEIVLKCGKASITLRRNGEVMVRGTYVETRSTGTNHIKGRSVRLN